MSRHVSYGLLIVFAGLTLLPLYWIVMTAFQLPSAVLAIPPDLFPASPTLLNFTRLFRGSQILTWLTNSVVVTVAVTISNILLGTLAGYTLAKKRFPGRQAIFWSVIGLMLIPGQLTIIPLYALIIKLDWVNTYKALIVPALIAPFSIFLMKQFLQTLPTELLEAARIDGCSEWGIFRRVILPLARPGMGVLGIFTFMGTWNEFLWPLIVTNRTSMMTLQIGLNSLQNQYFTDFGLLMAGAAVSAAPMVVVFLLFQPYFVRSITIGAVKG
ncbi:MAG: carbohydrate ABC transporter permease [candidate division Zixibacteria bacterium]|nr:carbohydrate ABC transporter permease [candidate division Zixibacteria bacterium]